MGWCCSARVLICSILLLAAASPAHCKLRNDADDIGLREPPKKRVAVVGGGIGGAAASYFLQEAGVEVTLFERSNELGGRSSSVPFDGDGQMLEMGAGILYTGNRYLYNLSLLLGLHHVSAPPRSFGLWDGDSFAFQSGRSKFTTSLKMLLRYGRSVLRLSATVKRRLSDFTQLYALQQHGHAYERPEELWAAVGLHNLTQTTIEQYLREEGMSQKIIAELVAAVNKVNYNQDNRLNALAGVVSLCPLVTGSTFTIQEGNAAIAQALGKVAHRVVLNAEIGSILLGRHPQTGARQYSLRLYNQTLLGSFDAVVLATPLELTNLTVAEKLTSFERAVPLQVPQRTYQATHTTWVRGALSPQLFSGRRRGGGVAARVGALVRRVGTLMSHGAGWVVGLYDALVLGGSGGGYHGVWSAGRAAGGSRPTGGWEALRCCARLPWVHSVRDDGPGCGRWADGDAGGLPESIYLTAKGAAHPYSFFSAIGRYREYNASRVGADGQEGVYKIFSSSALVRPQLDLLFGGKESPEGGWEEDPPWKVSEGTRTHTHAQTHTHTHAHARTRTPSLLPSLGRGAGRCRRGGETSDPSGESAASQKQNPARRGR